MGKRRRFVFAGRLPDLAAAATLTPAPLSFSFSHAILISGRRFFSGLEPRFPLRSHPFGRLDEHTPRPGLSRLSPNRFLVSTSPLVDASPLPLVASVSFHPLARHWPPIPAGWRDRLFAWSCCSVIYRNSSPFPPVRICPRSGFHVTPVPRSSRRQHSDRASNTHSSIADSQTSDNESIQRRGLELSSSGRSARPLHESEAIGSRKSSAWRQDRTLA